MLATGRAELPPAEHAGESLTRFEFVAPQMGTLFRLVFYATDAAEAQAAARAAFARVAALNRILSDYDRESELVRLTRQPPGTAVTLSAELFDVLERSQRLAAASGGAFDVTVGPLVRLWRETRRTRKLPSDGARTAALDMSGHDKLRLDATRRTATMLKPGMQLDLGGIAKGHAADEALAVLARLGFTRAMVAASGDLAVGEAPPAADGWRIELAPFGERVREPLVLFAANVGISTSAASEQFVEIGGIRYSHIVDPRTGLGLTNRVAVTVIARSAILSDAWATACSVLAANAPEAIPSAIGGAGRVLVFRSLEAAARPAETYGVRPPGLRTKL